MPALGEVTAKLAELESQMRELESEEQERQQLMATRRSEAESLRQVRVVLEWARVGVTGCKGQRGRAGCDGGVQGGLLG